MNEGLNGADSFYSSKLIETISSCEKTTAIICPKINLLLKWNLACIYSASKKKLLDRQGCLRCYFYVVAVQKRVSGLNVTTHLKFITLFSAYNYANQSMDRRRSFIASANGEVGDGQNYTVGIQK